MKHRSPPSGSEEAENGRDKSVGERQLESEDSSPVERLKINGADDDRSGSNAFCRVMSSESSKKYGNFASCKVYSHWRVCT